MLVRGDEDLLAILVFRFLYRFSFNEGLPMAALDLGWGNYAALSIYGYYAGASAVAVLFLRR